MKLGRVTNTVWGDARASGLEPFKFVEVKALEFGAQDELQEGSGELVAVDRLQSGPGDLVLVAHGSSVRAIGVAREARTK